APGLAQFPARTIGEAGVQIGDYPTLPDKRVRRTIFCRRAPDDLIEIVQAQRIAIRPGPEGAQIDYPTLIVKKCSLLAIKSAPAGNLPMIIDPARILQFPAAVHQKGTVEVQ